MEMEVKTQIRGKVKERYYEEGMIVFVLDDGNGWGFSLEEIKPFKEDIKRIRKGTEIVLNFDKDTNFVSIGF